MDEHNLNKLKKGDEEKQREGSGGKVPGRPPAANCRVSASAATALVSMRCRWHRGGVVCNLAGPVFFENLFGWFRLQQVQFDCRVHGDSVRSLNGGGSDDAIGSHM